MLNVCVEINGINYEETIEHCYPLIRDAVGRMKQRDIDAGRKSVATEFLYGLSSGMVPLAKGVLAPLGQDDRDELVVSCVNRFAPQIKQAIANTAYGQYVGIAHLTVERRDGKLYLCAGGVKVDYKGVLTLPQVQQVLRQKSGGFSGMVQGGLRFLLTLAPKTIEKKVLDSFWTDDNRAKVSAAIRSKLDEYGIRMTLGEIGAMQVSRSAVPAQPEPGANWLPEDLKLLLASSAAEYLKQRAA